MRSKGSYGSDCWEVFEEVEREFPGAFGLWGIRVRNDCVDGGVVAASGCVREGATGVAEGRACGMEVGARKEARRRARGEMGAEVVPVDP